MTLKIPVIDIDSDNAPADIRDACENIGFFYVPRAPILSVNSAFAESHNFFEKEIDFKLQTKAGATKRGYTCFQDQTSAPHVQQAGDTREGYYIWREPEVDEEGMYPNVWPDATVLPEWKATMTSYHAECTRYCERIVRLLAKALHLSAVESGLDQYIISRPTAKVRLIKYGTILSDPTNGIMGVGPHTDYGKKK
jgi:isopenicillin N synthase-like dioxygenase